MVNTRSKTPDPPGLTHGMCHRHAGGGGGVWHGSKGVLVNMRKTLGKYQTIIVPTHGSGMVVGWRWGGSGMGFGTLSQTHA